ncbi:MAG: nucleoside triphosphate hydrolase [Pseudomonadota bacterium]
MSLEDDVATVLAAIEKRASPAKPRTLIGIAGPPGAGKSTLAEAVVAKLNNKDAETACLVPMDGFHLDNAILRQRGLLAQKGSPQTFDAYGFVDLVRRVTKLDAPVYYPVFDRDRDIAIAGVGFVKIDTGIVVVEGNYLLLENEPWSQLASCFDMTVMLNPGLDTLRKRLIQRWRDQGIDDEKATERALSNDIPNAQFVIAHSAAADVQLYNKA